MSLRTAPRSSMASAFLLCAHLGALTGCGFPPAASSLGLVEVSWTIKGQPPTGAACSAISADKVRIRYSNASSVTHQCLEASVRRFAGDGTRLDLVVTLLSLDGATLDRKLGSVTVAAERTSTLAVDFVGAPVPELGVDWGLDSGPTPEVSCGPLPVQ